MNEEKQQDNKKPPHPDILKTIVYGLICLVVAVLIFDAGVRVGGIKARYAYLWADNYHRNFAGPSKGFMTGDWRNFIKGDFMQGHGIFGEIIEINDKDFVVRGSNDTENIILMTEKTVVKNGRETAETNALKAGDRVVIIGSPNEQGQIEAKFIRIFNDIGNKMPFRRLPQRFF